MGVEKRCGCGPVTVLAARLVEILQFDHDNMLGRDTGPAKMCDFPGGDCEGIHYELYSSALP